MRDYLYIWNDPVDQYIVASGIEFRDIAAHMDLGGGIILLSSSDEYEPPYAEDDRETWFSYIPKAFISRLAEENLYSWGDLHWVDYASEAYPRISDHEIAELLYFDHMGKPLDGIVLPSLTNRYLCYAHDDGWYLKLFYSSWNDAAALIATLCPRLDVKELHRGSTAYWASGTSVETEDRTNDIDSILNRRLP